MSYRSPEADVVGQKSSRREYRIGSSRGRPAGRRASGVLDRAHSHGLPTASGPTTSDEQPYQRLPRRPNPLGRQTQATTSDSGARGHLTSAAVCARSSSTQRGLCNPSSLRTNLYVLQTTHLGDGRVQTTKVLENGRQSV
ncbi:hypothetical protein L226DRAFT_276035 [Lentinus tigrinus ALCF2SS1-7]|uniref:uncharacterized protein n=1 Tax=Lentinus tigrinus ALCF2SS1-7 TaxID=1328758 RepID=UPI0011663095|nr:hypothetical protein L226DRAFT_276035 [Lentinus tigrinus ALCF2SS1-7]